MQMLKTVEPTAELTIHKTKQGGHTFSLRVKGMVHCEEEPAQKVCEKMCALAGAQPLTVQVPFRRGMSIFYTLHHERLNAAGFQVMPHS
jgi:hypothetical protein